MHGRGLAWRGYVTKHGTNLFASPEVLQANGRGFHFLDSALQQSFDLSNLVKTRMVFRESKT